MSTAGNLRLAIWRFCSKYTFIFRKKFYLSGKYAVTKPCPATAQILSCGSLLKQSFYLHQLPHETVEKGLVYKPEDYVYSSALDYTGQKGVVDDVVVFRMLGIY